MAVQVSGISSPPLPMVSNLVAQVDPDLEATASAVSVAAAPILAAFTPPRKKENAFVFSPSIVASPDVPRAMNASHSAVRLLTDFPLKQAKKLPGKSSHSLCVTASAEKASRFLTDPKVAKHVSRSSRHCLKYPDQPVPPLEVEPDVELTVTKPDVVVVSNKQTKRKRSFGLHRHDGVKNIFPIDGDGVVVTNKGQRPSPDDLFQIFKKHKTNPTADPAKFAQDEIDKLLSLPESSS